VIVADVATQDRVGMGLEDSAEAAAMRRLLMADEQILERRDTASEELLQMSLDDRKILRMAGLDQARRRLARAQRAAIVAVIDLALVALRQAIADPEHAGRDLARHVVGLGPLEHIQRSSSRVT